MIKPSIQMLHTPQHKIESQEILAGTGRRRYEMLRLTRVKYSENPPTFIDLRLFQRGWNDEGDEEVYHLA